MNAWNGVGTKKFVHVLKYRYSLRKYLHKLFIKTNISIVLTCYLISAMPASFSYRDVGTFAHN